MRNVFICTLLAGFLAGSAELRADDKVDFATQIYPFVKSGCVKCHRPPYEYERSGRTRTRKPKAGIILSTKEGILNSVDENENKILVPGDAEKSRMLAVTHLPLDDDYHFPPQGDAPQWTDAEKALFAKWVTQGADFGEWTEDKSPEKAEEYVDAWEEGGSKEKAADTVETFDSELWKKVNG